MQHTPEKLAVFDLDETLTYKDTMLRFLQLYCGNAKTYAALLWHAPMLVLAWRGIISWQRAKEGLYTTLLAGEPVSQVQEFEKEFATRHLPPMLNPVVYGRLQQHLQNGFEVVLLTASSNIWLSEWCRINGIKLMCSAMEVQNGRLTGKLSGKNCYGPEKLTRLKEKYNLEQVKELIAYGNYPADVPYMQIAHKAYYVNNGQLIEP